MFYIGWTQGAKVPYMAALGLASSNNLNKKFKRISLAPIIDGQIMINIYCFMLRSEVKKLFQNFLYV